jgi:rRNA-processing protein FCF1
VGLEEDVITPTDLRNLADAEFATLDEINAALRNAADKIERLEAWAEKLDLTVKMLASDVALRRTLDELNVPVAHVEKES